MLEHDRKWFEKTVRQRPRGRGSSPGSNRFDRDQFDSELAEKVTHIIRELKSTSHRPVRITLHRVLRRAGGLAKYSQFSADLPKTQALLDDHVETMATYRVRKIRWAIAEIARTGQAVIGETLRRKAGLSTALLQEHKQLVLETAQQLGGQCGTTLFLCPGMTGRATRIIVGQADTADGDRCGLECWDCSKTNH